MPRKQVYGKKRAPLASFAAYAAVLNSSSPLKPEAPDEKADVDVEDVVHDLENLNIQQDGRHDANNEDEEDKRILKLKDANIPGRQSARRKKGDTSVKNPAVGAQVQEVLEVEKTETRYQKKTRKAPSADTKSQPKRSSAPLTEPPQPQILTEKPSKLRNRPTEAASPQPPSSHVEPTELPQEPCKEPTCLSPLLALSIADAHRTEPLTFAEWSEQLESHFHITKIAEASYGEVYRLSLLPCALKQTNLTAADDSVLKIIALQPEQTQAYGKKAWMSQPAAVAEEARLLARMTDVPGFTNFRDVRVLRGRPGKAFIKAWKNYNKVANKDDRSIFPDPARRTSYDEAQYWAVVEMQDAGIDVEKGIASTTKGEYNILRTVWGVWDIFWSVALALAKGEEAADFEHRDLHLGNICVRLARGDVKNGNRGVRGAKVRPGKNKIGFTGLETTIIDYTLSRATMTGDTVVSNGKEGDVAFFDLATDPMIFEGDGDVEYQYDMYRYMLAILHTDDPLASPSSSVEILEKVRQSKATWRDYIPKTNVLWLHFVLFKLMETMGESALEEVLEKGEDVYEARRRERSLRATLKKMEKKLRLTALKGENALSSAGALVQLAVEQGWLDEEDVLYSGSGDTSIA